MLAKLLRWLFAFSIEQPRPAVAVEPVPLPSFNRPADRFIFEYWDGTANRRQDPAIAWERWKETGYDLDDEIAAADRGDVASQNNLARAADLMFGTKPLDQDGGLTVEERGMLFGEFLNFLVVIKKKRDLLQTPTLPFPTQSTGESSPTPSNSGSSLTPNESSDAAPIVPLKRSIQL